MHLGHTCIFHKGFCMVYFGDNKTTAVTFLHSEQRKYAFLVKKREMLSQRKWSLEKKFALEYYTIAQDKDIPDH